jgi:hypothetical protein
MAARPYAHQVPGPGALLQLIRSGSATSRSDLARVTGLSRTAVAARLAGLVDAQLVVESGEGASTGGRPPMRLSFNPAAGSVFAAAVGRSRIQVGLCDLSGRALAMGTHDQDVADGPEVVLTQVRDMFDQLLVQAGVEASSVRGIGVSIPGVVGPDRATALSAPALPGWEGVPSCPT